MAIKKYFVTQQKEGYQYDRKEGKYFSWGFDIWLNRERISERGFFTKDKAEEAVKALREQSKDTRFGIPTRTESPLLIELFQKKLDTMPKGPERARAKRVFKAFLSLLPPNIKVIELKKAHLRTYQDSRTVDGVKGSTIKREMVPIIEVLNNADQYSPKLDGYRPPKRPTLVISKTRKTVTIKHDERKALLSYLLAPESVTERVHQAAARQRVGLFLQLCLLTVSRPGEIAGIRKADIDFHAGILRIHGTKTKDKQHSTREIPITPTIRSILEERIEKTKTEYIFTRSGKLTHRMSEVFKNACEAVGITYGRDALDGITLYTARHTATTVLAHSNRVDTKTAGHFTGHSDENMTLYYTHPSPETLQIASEVLEETMGRKLLDGVLLETLPK